MLIAYAALDASFLMLIRRIKKMYKCVMFDLDGTLCDTLRDLAEATNFALRVGGYPQQPLEKYKIMVGNGLTRLMERALPAEAVMKENVMATRAAMLAYYQQHLLDYTRAYPGITALVKRLKEQGKALYVVTNKPQAQASVIVETLFPDCFAGVAGQREGMPTKPDPWGIHLFMEEGGFAAEECLFVGDSNVDAQTAAAGGLECVGVTWGFRSRQELLDAGAGWAVDTAEELETIIG